MSSKVVVSSKPIKINPENEASEDIILPAGHFLSARCVVYQLPRLIFQYLTFHPILSDFKDSTSSTSRRSNSHPNISYHRGSFSSALSFIRIQRCGPQSPEIQYYSNNHVAIISNLRYQISTGVSQPVIFCRSFPLYC